MDSTAVFGRRVAAALIDAALLIIPVVVLFVGTFEYLDVAGLDRDPQTWCDDYMDRFDGFCADLSDVNDRVYFSDGPDGSTAVLAWGGAFVLYVVLQGLTGWTVGKLLLGIRVVREDGSRPGIGRALLRWVLLVVDGQPCGLPLVGFITALTTTGHRRVGDMAARTYVVRAGAAGSPVITPGGFDSTGADWQPAAPAAPPVGAPQWDAARGAYIQWDAARARWLQWDDATRTWSEIPGQ